MKPLKCVLSNPQNKKIGFHWLSIASPPYKSLKFKLNNVWMAPSAKKDFNYWITWRMEGVSSKETSWVVQKEIHFEWIHRFLLQSLQPKGAYINDVTKVREGCPWLYDSVYEDVSKTFTWAGQRGRGQFQVKIVWCHLWLLPNATQNIMLFLSFFLSFSLSLSLSLIIIFLFVPNPLFCWHSYWSTSF